MNNFIEEPLEPLAELEMRNVDLDEVFEAITYFREAHPEHHKVEVHYDYREGDLKIKLYS